MTQWRGQPGAYLKTLFLFLRAPLRWTWDSHCHLNSPYPNPWMIGVIIKRFPFSLKIWSKIPPCFRSRAKPSRFCVTAWVHLELLSPIWKAGFVPWEWPRLRNSPHQAFHNAAWFCPIPPRVPNYTACSAWPFLFFFWMLAWRMGWVWMCALVVLRTSLGERHSASWLGFGLQMGLPQVFFQFSLQLKLEMIKGICRS